MLHPSHVEAYLSDPAYSDNIIAEIPHKIGWRPTWNKDRFLQNIDDEIQAVVEHRKAKSSLIDSLFEFAAE